MTQAAPINMNTTELIIAWNDSSDMEDKDAATPCSPWCSGMIWNWIWQKNALDTASERTQ
jgi:hypothetical protein